MSNNNIDNANNISMVCCGVVSKYKLGMPTVVTVAPHFTVITNYWHGTNTSSVTFFWR